MDKQDRTIEFIKHSGRNISEYRDNKTGVHYLVYAESTGNGGGIGGMCPRYNADGSLYVD